MSLSPRTRLRRLPKRSVEEREQAYAIIDECLICHVAGFNGEHATVLPTAHWRMGDYVYLHGHGKNGLLRQLLDGQEASLCFTLIDGLVLAKSAFHHSMNYRSVVMFGKAEEVTGAHKAESLDAFVDKVAPGRAAQARPGNEIELKATLVLRIPLTDWSCKVRVGPSSDDAEDLPLLVWSGVIPLSLQAGAPLPDYADGPLPQLPAGIVTTAVTTVVSTPVGEV
ncbi:hypothetical protein WH50_13730 [Pokkaliibacter plantistimulans]|uniref:Flavin-nucleotide-binding protein n=1 Tax=Pokkaliibacter plantistimulans TaxID=1635171 RepID=A0ABX5LVQ5_9GAMM|nr:pyridoxamine 5'-phosphate oxidase family protein [Pokkaliibacter plantistimulans]PXF30714.1 hypothetical protein WH50_13730 [Pokkaliibacter plantistimulans]